MKTITKFHVGGLVLAAVALLLSALAYGHLPDPVPTHWNWHGEVDGWTPKPLGAFVLPLLMVGLSVLFVVLPRISPQRFRMEGFDRAYGVMILALQSLFLLLTGLVHLAGMGFDVDVGRTVALTIGLLFMVFGNYLGKVTRNFFLGIRTPWTLASEEVWLRTHRMGGRVMVAMGVGLVLSALFGVHRATMLPILALSLTPIAYSYFIYRRLEGQRSA